MECGLGKVEDVKLVNGKGRVTGYYHRGGGGVLAGWVKFGETLEDGFNYLSDALSCVAFTGSSFSSCFPNMANPKPIANQGFPLYFHW